MIRPLLMQARRRLIAQTTLRYAATAWLAGACILVGVALIAPQRIGITAAVLFILTTLAAFIAARWQQPSLEQVARQLDRSAATRDRLTTAYALEQHASPSPMETAALAECRSYLTGFDPTPWQPWQMPRLLPWLAAPVIALIGLQFWNPTAGDLAGGTTTPDPAALAAAERLEEMAKSLQEKPESDALKKVAEALKESADRLRGEAESQSPDDAHRALLRELSAAEDAMKSARQQGAMDALAEAMKPMESQPHAAEAMEALRKGRAGEAARAMEQLAEALAAAQSGEGAGSREERMAQLQAAMQQAMEKLGEASRMGQAAAQAAEAARRGDSPGASQAMRQMGQALRESRSGDGSSPSQQGQPGDAEEIRKMLAALESMRQSGQPQPGQGEGAGEGQQQGAATQPAPGSGSPGQESGQPGAGDLASGQAGSEMDQGSKAQPFGSEATPPPAPADLQTQIQGLFGEGESLHTLLPSRSGEAPARTGYRELYEAAAPAAEDAMERENIPLGARLTIKRYFESIRPNR